MRLATNYERIHGAGAEVIAVSVDDDVRQAGMAQRWGLPATRFVSDPGGERFLQPLGLYDPEERGGLGLTALVIVDADAEERYRYVGRDFADRTGDDDVLEALESLGLPPIEAPAWTYDVEVPSDLRGVFRPRDLPTYFRGNMFGALAIGWRVGDEDSRAIAKQHRLMSKSILDAHEQWSPNIPDEA